MCLSISQDKFHQTCGLEEVESVNWPEAVRATQLMTTVLIGLRSTSPLKMAPLLALC